VNEDEIERIGHRAVGTFNAAVRSRVDTDDVLRRILEADSATSVVAITDRPDRDQRRRRLSALAIAMAATAIVVAGGFVLARRNDSARVVPVDSSIQTNVATTATTAAPTSTTEPSTTPATAPTPTESSAQIHQAPVTVNSQTPLIEGTTLYLAAVANTHPWFAAVTPSGRVFVGPSDGTTADISEVVDGSTIPTGVVTNGELRSALDERLYSIDHAADQLEVWAEGPGATWAIDQTGGSVVDCGFFIVQPDAVHCGPATIAMKSAIDAATIEWSGFQLTATTADRVTRWALAVDSTDISVIGCDDEQCQETWRVGRTDIAWTPELSQGRDDARLVSVLHADAPPDTAWLDCGTDCRIIGSRDGYLYTIGHGPGDAGQGSIVIRQFSTDFSPPAEPPLIPAEFTTADDGEFANATVAVDRNVTPRASTDLLVAAVRQVIESQPDTCETPRRISLLDDTTIRVLFGCDDSTGGIDFRIVGAEGAGTFDVAIVERRQLCRRGADGALCV
jgi:hypothetical protein